MSFGRAVVGATRDRTRASRLLPPRQRRIERRRREDRQVRLRPVGQEVAGGDQPTGRMAVQDDGPAAGPAPDRGQTLGQVVVELRPVVDVTAPAAGSTRCRAGRRRSRRCRRPPAGRRRARTGPSAQPGRARAAPRPTAGPAHAPPASASSIGQCRTSRSVPSAAVTCRTREGMRAGYATGRAAYPASDAGGCQAGSPTAGCAIGPSCAWVACARAPARAGMNRAAIAPNPTTTAPTAMAGCNPATYAAGVV